MSHETAVPAAAGSAAVVSCADNSSKVEVIVYTTKSDKTLKQNMNAKDDTLRKRTSLIIVPQQVHDIEVEDGEKDPGSKAKENGNRNSTASMDSCVSNTTSQSNQSSGGSSSSTSSGSSSGSEDAHAAYQDLQNGNAGQDLHSPSPVPRCHSSSSSTGSESTSCSSSADYSLREQLKNFANRNAEEQLRSSAAGVGVAGDPTTVRLLKGMSLPVGDQQSVAPAICDALLSPQEVPLGRRYAEVAQFKGHPKARTSEPLPSAGATPSSLEAASLDAGNAHGGNNNNINNNHNGQQSQKSQQQASLSAISSKLNVLAQSNLNNNNTSSQSGSMTSAPNRNALDSNQNQNPNADSRRSSSLDPDVDDVVDAAHGGAFEDDMQALLPKCSRRSRDELSQSRTSLVSSSEGGILAEGETSSEADEEEPVEAEDEDEDDGEESSRDSSDNSPPCDLGLMERLLLTHPMWFLPGIQRSGAVHLLQGKEEG
uniref:Protein sprint-like n=1 Tax=Drosophila rhopaloa TaxID=1041015 RepID=A0A6P4FXF2_DRORH